MAEVNSKNCLSCAVSYRVGCQPGSGTLKTATRILFLGFIPLNQSLLKGTTGVVRLLGSVTNEKLFFYSVIQIACLLKGTDINFQECVQPTKLVDVLRSECFSVEYNEYTPQDPARTELFAH